MNNKFHIEQINPKDVDFDQLNPRGEKPNQIIADPAFKKLQNSIKQYGVYQPIIVQEQKGTHPYLLVDGERRLRAVLSLDFNKIPANITSSEIESSIVAYQIHQNRKQWSIPSEAKAIKRIIDSIKKSDPGISDSNVKKKLIALTSHKESAISDILRILKYPDEIQKKAADGNIDHSYLVRIDGDFIVPLSKKIPDLFNAYGDQKLREIMIKKAEKKLLKNTRYMMISGFKDIFKPSYIFNLK